MCGKVQSLALAAVLATVAGSSAAQDASSAEIRPPLVVVQPDQWAIPPRPAAYPRRALEHDVDGRVVLTCAPLSTGRLTDCQVLEETPPDYGFRAAALTAADGALLSPEMAAAMAPEDRLTVPVDFRLAR